MQAKERDINNKIVICKEILKNVYEILTIFQPLMNKMLKMNEAKKYRENGSFERAAFLFGEISDLCKEIEDISSVPDDLIKNLGN
ncbi:MAG: hypothetical protein ACFE9I_07090 [Candidatus Hermodarchaeota archaeon]